jgi:hypothetical protein
MSDDDRQCHHRQRQKDLSERLYLKALQWIGTQGNGMLRSLVPVGRTSQERRKLPAAVPGRTEPTSRLSCHREISA